PAAWRRLYAWRPSWHPGRTVRWKKVPPRLIIDDGCRRRDDNSCTGTDFGRRYGRAGTRHHSTEISMKALILTGGAGRSLAPFSATRPKAMTVVAGGSLMRRTLTHLHDVGVTDVTVVIGQNGDKVRTNFQDGQDLGLNLSYVEQERPGGIADA